MATKSKYQINAVTTAVSSTCMWKITNLLTGEINLFPVSKTNFTMQVNPSTTGSITTTSDYNFIWNKDDLHQLIINIIDVKYIGASGTPNYNTPATDYASILALV